MLKVYANRFPLTHWSRVRVFSLICSAETTLRPRSASWKLMLDCLKARLPASVSDLGHCTISERMPKLGVQFLNVSDLFAETCDLVSKNPYMIHIFRWSSGKRPARPKRGQPRHRENSTMGEPWRSGVGFGESPQRHQANERQWAA